MNQSVIWSFKDLLPIGLRTILRERYLTIRYYGTEAYCPCCNQNLKMFLPFGVGVKHRPWARCPICYSLERHRLLWMFLNNETNLFKDPLKVLHIAPEVVLLKKFKSLKNLDYVTADLNSHLAQVKMDITQIPFPENTFDVIICIHVLEHIVDDQQAMRELYRVLKPGGWAILQVPLAMNRETTFEDATITDPEERLHLFEQSDHVRIYGRDYGQRLKDAGFHVNVHPFVRQFSADEIHRLGLVGDEDIYYCTK